MSIEEKINNLRDLQENLYNFRSELQFKKKDLSQQIDHLEKDDVLSETIELYRANQFTSLNKQVQHIVEDLYYHLEYIDRLIDYYRPDIFIDEKGKLY